MDIISTMPSIAVQAEAPPIRMEPDGSYRVGTSRVLLDIVIGTFQLGATPETIVQQYPSVALGDVYAVIAHYLRHKPEVDAYLAAREREAEEIRARIEKSQPDLADIRARLLAHRHG